MFFDHYRHFYHYLDCLRSDYAGILIVSQNSVQQMITWKPRFGSVVDVKEDLDGGIGISVFSLSFWPLLSYQLKLKSFLGYQGILPAPLVSYQLFNPLRPNSDLGQTSHCNIKDLSRHEN